MTQHDLNTGEDGEREETPDEREDRLFDEDEGDERLYDESWAAAVVSTVAAEVCRRRTELGLSQQDLAERCTEIGYAIPRNVLANLESGRRTSLQVIELLVLSEALHCVPVALLFPVGRRTSVHPLPGDSWSPLHAADWFSGLTSDSADDTLFLYRYYAKEEKALAVTRGALIDLREALSSSSDPNERDELQRDITQLSEKRDRLSARLAHQRAALQADGRLAPPAAFAPLPFLHLFMPSEETP